MLVYVIIDYKYYEDLDVLDKDLIAVFDSFEKAEKYIFEKYKGAKLDLNPDSWFPETYLWPDPRRYEITHHLDIFEKEVL